MPTEPRLQIGVRSLYVEGVIQYPDDDKVGGLVMIFLKPVSPEAALHMRARLPPPEIETSKGRERK